MISFFLVTKKSCFFVQINPIFGGNQKGGFIPPSITQEGGWVFQQFLTKKSRNLTLFGDFDDRNVDDIFWKHRFSFKKSGAKFPKIQVFQRDFKKWKLFVQNTCFFLKKSQFLVLWFSRKTKFRKFKKKVCKTQSLQPGIG